MIIFELVNTENNPVYRALEVSNGNRQYDFLRSIVQASLDMGKPFLSQHVIKAFNFHAIACLHTNPGEYRPCPVTVGGGPGVPPQYVAPAHYRVPALMDDFVNTVNRTWDQTTDPVYLATYVLWRINNIHHSSMEMAGLQERLVILRFALPPAVCCLALRFCPN